MKKSKTSTASAGSGSQSMTLGYEKAIALARQAAEAKNIELADSKPTTRKVACFWVVTFPIAPAPGQRPGDYLAQVWVNGQTGKIEEFDGGQALSVERGAASERIPRISRQDAIAAAARAAEGRGLDVRNSKPVVEKRAVFWIVTFPVPRTAGKRTADYIAQVYVNSETGKIEEFMVGS